MADERKARDSVLNEFLGDNHLDGTLIPHSYFWKLFGLKEPRGLVKYEDVKKINFAFASYMANLTEDLLYEHKKCLINEFAKGYKLLSDQDRIPVVSKDTNSALRKAAKNGIDRLSYMDHPEQLPFELQRKRDDSMSKWAHMEAIRRNKKRFDDD